MWGTGIMGKSPTMLAAIAVSSLVLVNSAPVDDWNSNSELAFPDDGCYYQYRHYDEGDQIITNEPCLNCTCHNQMLMCFLRVCPFIKPVGKNCIVEKKDDQCCPTISCPPVPVDIWTSTPLPPPLIAQQDEIETDLSMLPMSNNPGGCDIDGQFYMDGMKIPSDPSSPCDLCYCIRNHTACVMQECILKVEGCEPIFMDGICCPVKYICEDGSILPPLLGHDNDEESTDMTVVSPKPTQPGCYNNGQFYANGADIVTEDPCEHCYCLNGDVVCAIQECMGPLEGKTDNCQALPPPPGQCCPAEYKCNPVTTLPPFTVSTPTTAGNDQEVVTILSTSSSLDEKFDEATESTNDQTSLASDANIENEIIVTTEETIKGEINDDDVDDIDTTENPVQIESTSVSQIVTDTISSISSLFGVSSDAIDSQNNKIDSAETEKSPVNGQIPGISVQNIEDSLEEDIYDEVQDKVDEVLSETESTVISLALEGSGNNRVDFTTVGSTSAENEYATVVSDNESFETTESNAQSEETTTFHSLGEIQYDDNYDDYEYGDTESNTESRPEESDNESSATDDSSSSLSSEENVSTTNGEILSSTEAVTSSILENTESGEGETSNTSTLEEEYVNDEEISEANDLVGTETIPEELTEGNDAAQHEKTTEATSTDGIKEMEAEITTENDKEQLNDDVIGTTVSTVTNDLSDSLDEESLDDYPDELTTTDKALEATTSANGITVEQSEEMENNINLINGGETNKEVEDIEGSSSLSADIVTTEASGLSVSSLQEDIDTTEKSESNLHSEDNSGPISTVNGDITTSTAEIEHSSENSLEGTTLTTEIENQDNKEEDLIFTTEPSDSICDPQSCIPPAGFEFCRPLPARKGECCPEQYECTTETTTIIVTTEGAIFDGSSTELLISEPEKEVDNDSATESILQESSFNTESTETEDITTDATASVENLMTDTKPCEDMNGTIYEHLEDVPSNDVCQLCQCSNGEILCAVEECVLPEPYYDSCKPLPVKEGKCCPEYSCELPDASTTISSAQAESSDGDKDAFLETTTTIDILSGDIQYDDADGDYEYDSYSESQTQGTDNIDSRPESTSEASEDATLSVAEYDEIRTEETATKPHISTEEDNDKVSGTIEATLENDLEYDDEKESTEGSGIVETDDEHNELLASTVPTDTENKVEADELVVPQQGALQEETVPTTSTESSIQQEITTLVESDTNEGVSEYDEISVTVQDSQDNIQYDIVTELVPSENETENDANGPDTETNTEKQTSSEAFTEIQDNIGEATESTNIQTTEVNTHGNEITLITTSQTLTDNLEESNISNNEEENIGDSDTQDSTTEGSSIDHTIEDMENKLEENVSPQNAVDETFLQNEENGDKNTLPESVTKPTEGGLTTSDTLLCLVLGMDNCANKPGQNITESQDEANDKLDNVVLNSGECLYEGKIYQDFEDVETSNPCNLCYCSFGEVICAERECIPPTGYEFCIPLPVPQGKCCPEQYECNAISSTGEPVITAVVTNAPESLPVGPDGNAGTTTNPFVDEADIQSPGTHDEAGPPAPPNNEIISCVQDGVIYDNNSYIPPVEKCDDSCWCDEGSILCARLPCHPAPEDQNCFEVFEEGECCPTIQCIGDVPPKPESDSHIIENYTTETTNINITESHTEGASTEEFVDDTTNISELEESDKVVITTEETFIAEEAGTNNENDDAENLPSTVLTESYETTDKSGLDTEDVKSTTSKQGVEEMEITTSLEELEDVDTTTSLQELQYDDADEYDDDSFLDGCNYNGTTYENFQDVPSSDPCQLCQCFKGEVICAERECVTPSGYENCKPLPPQKGVCCPSSWECDDNLEVFETTSLSSSIFTEASAAIDQEVEQETEMPGSLLVDRPEVTTPGIEFDNVQTTVQGFVETEVTTEDDLASTFLETCNPINCKAPAGYEFCQPLPVEDGKCCPSQYECNVSTTTSDPTTIIVSVTDENDTRFNTTEDAIDLIPVPECNLDNCKAPEGYETCQPLPVLQGECCPSQYECSVSTTEGPTTVIVDITATEGIIEEDHISSTTLSDSQEVTTQFASYLETESNSVDFEVGTTTISGEVTSEKEYESTSNSIESTEVEGLVIDNEKDDKNEEVTNNITGSGESDVESLEGSGDHDEVSETQDDKFGDEDTETEESANVSDSSESLDTGSGDSATGSLENNSDESVTGPAEMEETTAQSLDLFTGSEDVNSESGDSEIDSEDPQTELAILETGSGDLTTEVEITVTEEPITELQESITEVINSITESDESELEGSGSKQGESTTERESGDSVSIQEENVTESGEISTEAEENATGTEESVTDIQESGNEPEHPNTESSDSATDTEVSVNGQEETVTEMTDSGTASNEYNTESGGDDSETLELTTETETSSTQSASNDTTQSEINEDNDVGTTESNVPDSGESSTEPVTSVETASEVQEVDTEVGSGELDQEIAEADYAQEDSDVGDESLTVTTASSGIDASITTQLVTLEKEDSISTHENEIGSAEATTKQSNSDQETTTKTVEDISSIELSTIQAIQEEESVETVNAGTETTGIENEETMSEENGIESESPTTEGSIGEISGTSLPQEILSGSEEDEIHVSTQTEAEYQEATTATVTDIDVEQTDIETDKDTSSSKPINEISEETSTMESIEIEDETEETKEATTATVTDIDVEQTDIETDKDTSSLKPINEISEETSTMGSIDIEDETEETKEPTGQELYVTESSELVAEVSASMGSGVSLTTETQTEAEEDLEDTESGLLEAETESSVDEDMAEEITESPDSSTRSPSIQTEEVTSTENIENEPESTTKLLSSVTESEATQAPLIDSSEEASSETTTLEGETDDEPKKPSLKFCLHKGMIIQNLADVPSKDPCQLCQCVEGDIVCATQECQAPPKEGCTKIVEEGQCCPKYDCDGSNEETTASSGEVDLIKTTVSGEIQDDDIEEYDEEGEDEIILEFPTTTKPQTSSTTFKPISSPKPIATTQLTTLLTTTLAQEGLVTTVTPAAITQNEDGTFGTASGTSLDNDEYLDIDLESIGPGACLFENKIYVSAQQIPRDNPCDFCFCFRGDIICLQQSCPPPIPGCTEEIISGFCCPRYECPVKMSIHNVTKHISHATEPPSIASWFGWGAQEPQQEEEIYSAEVKGCEVQGEFYETGAIVTASSGPCLQCRCDYNEKLDCEPQDCETQPLIKRMMENFR